MYDKKHVYIDGDHIVIRLPLAKNPDYSKSGKSIIIAGSGGFSDCEEIAPNGKRISISVNVTTPAR